MKNGRFYLCHRMGKKMKNDEGLGKHLNEKYLQQIAPAEIKAVAT